MAVDLSKLTPAPWTVKGVRVPIGDTGDYDEMIEVVAGKSGTRGIMQFYNPLDADDANVEFITLARNAFDVMLRRGWTATKWMPHDAKHGQWIAVSEWDDEIDPSGKTWPDPFTALCAADEWYKKNVEGKPTQE